MSLIHIVGPRTPQEAQARTNARQRQATASLYRRRGQPQTAGGTVLVPVSASSAGTFTVTHALQKAPDFIVLTSSASFYLPSWGAVTSTTFLITVRHIETVTATLNVPVSWYASL